MHNFTVADLIQTTLATFVFALFFVPPGYLLGLASNAFGFRRSSAAEKLLFSVAFSISTTPILAVLLTRGFSYKITLAFFLLLGLISVSTLIREVPRLSTPTSGVRRSTTVLACMMLAWFLVVQFSLADLQVGHRLYVSYVAYDHSVRTPFVWAASRNGVPPLNPFFGLGNIPVLRYYYYWYVVCALPMQLFGLGAKACLDASVFWSGLGIASTIPLFLKHFLRETEHLRRKSVVGIALLTVTGLDLLPYAAVVSIYHLFPGDMEWWEPNQVASWMGSLVWVPHHVAALTACMAGLLAISAIDEETQLRPAIWAVLLSGLAFASAAGLSVYVTFTFAIFAVCWAVWELLRGRVKTLIAYVTAGALSLLLSWPYLIDLLSKRVETGLKPGVGDQFAFFAIRDYPEVLTYIVHLAGIHSSLLIELLKVPILLIVYVLEFGFFLLVMGLRLRQDTSSGASLKKQQRMAWALFAICLLTMSTVQSNSTNSNDLGFRGILVVQFVLLIWAAPIVDDVFFVKRGAGDKRSITPWIKASLFITLLLGVAGTAYQFVALRCYSPMADHGKIRRSERFLGHAGFGERTYWLREGYSRLNDLTASTTFVQYNPVGDQVYMTHLYSTRQAVIGDEGCASVFGGEISKCKKAFPYVASIFNSPDAVRNWNLDAVCDAFHVSVLVATDVDPVWQDPNSWVWTRRDLFSNPAMRAIPCGTVANSSVAQ